MNRHELTGLVLAVFAVFVLSMVGSLIVINKLSINPFLLTTGNVAEGIGNVSISVAGTISITTSDDAIIEFSGCKPGGIIYSNSVAGGNDSLCPGFFPDEILVRNDGNTPANITVQLSDWGEAHNGSFIDAADNSSWVAFSARNESSNETGFAGGCLQELQSSWLNVTNSSRFPVCGWLQQNGVNNSLAFDLAVFVPVSTIKGSSQLTIQFIASNPN